MDIRPACFQLFGAAVKALRESYGMGDDGWSDIGHISSFVYVGDSIWLGSAFGSMLAGPLEACDWSRRRIRNERSINSMETELGRKWGAECIGTGVFDRYGEGLQLSAGTEGCSRS